VLTVLESWRASDPLPDLMTADVLAAAETELAATCPPVDDVTLEQVLGRLLDFGKRNDLIGGTHRLPRAEADRWEAGALHDLRGALGSLPAPAVLAGVEALLATWRHPRLPLPGDVRAAVEALPAWTATRSALYRIRTAQWALRKASR